MTYHVVAAARELGLLRTPPSGFTDWWLWVGHVHDQAAADPPVLDVVRRDAREKVAAGAGIDPASVVLVEFSGTYLRAVAERLDHLHRIDPVNHPLPPANVGAILAFAPTNQPATPAGPNQKD